jgi:F-type H+-transporting ATPase subunit delta
MSSSSGIAKRYVKALFELADAAGKIDAIARDFHDLEKILTESSELRRIVEASAISRDSQKMLWLWFWKKQEQIS